jgi:ATP synthase protein I
MDFGIMLRVRYVEAGMSRWVAALRLTGVGFFIGLCILLGTFIGLWLDGKLNTKPLFMIGGLIIGLVVAFYGVYQMIRPLMGNKQDKEDS